MPLINLVVDPDRSWRSAVAGESLYPNGRKHQVHFERRRSHRCSVVALERIWTVSFPSHEYALGRKGATGANGIIAGHEPRDHAPRIAAMEAAQL